MSTYDYRLDPAAWLRDFYVKPRTMDCDEGRAPTPADRLRARIARIPYFGEPLPPPVYADYKIGIDWGRGCPPYTTSILKTLGIS